MVEHLFYLSYAHKDLNAYLERFQSDLAQQVGVLNGKDQPVSFFDTDSLTAGADWTQGIAEALATSRALVALLSPNYFASESAGREWEVFRRRLEKSPGKRQGTSLIFPVRWIPVESPHAAVQEIQIDSSEFPEEYKRKGLLYLMKLRQMERDYEQFLDVLSRRIVEETSAHAFPPILPPVLHETPSAFAKPLRLVLEQKSPRTQSVWFAFASPEQPGEEVRRQTEAACAEEDLAFRSIEVDEELLDRVRDLERTGDLFILILDPLFLRNVVYRLLIEDFTNHRFFHTATIVSWNEEAKANSALRDLVNKVFARTGVHHVDSISELGPELRHTIARLRVDIVRQAPLLRSIEVLQSMPFPTLQGPDV